MFIHLTKDYLKKLEEIDRRLEVCLDKEEIQTLGLKLRFYYNEIKHYRSLLENLFGKIVQLQEKYGFSTDDDSPGKFGETKRATGVVDRSTGTEGETRTFKEFAPPVLKKTELLEQKAISYSEDIPSVSDSGKQAESKGLRLDDILNRAKDFLTEGGTSAAFIEKLKEKAMEKEIRTTGLSADETTPGEEPDVDAGVADETFQAATTETIMSLTEKLSDWEEELETVGVGKVMEEMESHLRAHIKEMMEWVNEMEGEAGVWAPEGNGGRDLIYGVLYMVAGRDGTAINMFESAIKKGVDYAEVNFLLGECLLNKKLYERALMGFRAALEHDSSQADAVLRIGDCLRQLGRYEEAVEVLGDYDFREKKHRLTGGMKRVDALIGMNKYSEAVESAKALVEECDTVAERSQCYYLMAKAKEKKGDILSAIDLYERSIEADSANGEARLGLGKLYLQHRALPLAKNHFTYLLRNFPDSVCADEARQLMYEEENFGEGNETVSFGN